MNENMSDRVIPLAVDVNGCPARRQGFTLLELLVVMTLIGFMAGVAVPRMFLAAESVSAAAEEHALADMVKEVKFYAYLRHAPQLLIFEGRYIFRDEGRSTAAEFTHLRFPNQRITWNTNGFSEKRRLEYTLRDQTKTLVLE